MSVQLTGDEADAVLGDALGRLYRIANVLPPESIATIVDVVGDIVGARSGTLYVADYGLRSVRQLGPDGPVGLR